MYTWMTEREAARAGVTAPDDNDGERCRKYGPYSMTQLWERWGTRGKRLETWSKWREFEVRCLSGHVLRPLAPCNWRVRGSIAPSYGVQWEGIPPVLFSVGGTRTACE